VGYEKMNIQTVAKNLRNTIAGKEKALEGYREDYEYSTMGEGIALSATIHYLEININELKRILEDVEQCIEKETT
jgi:hypothetical protein